MHLRHLLVQNCKLMRQLEVPFVRADGSPRLWTVFVGENGTCKTTLLRAIALAAAGSAFANALVGDPSGYMNRRAKDGAYAFVEAGFGFAAAHHAVRAYPGLPGRPAAPPEVFARAAIGPNAITFHAAYAPWSARQRVMDAMAARETLALVEDVVRAMSEQDPERAAQLAAAMAEAAARPQGGTGASTLIDEVRSSGTKHWFVAGYGVARIVAAPLAAFEGEPPGRAQLRSLFDPRHLPRGTGFSDTLAAQFGEDRARAFARCLRTALVDRMHTPKLNTIELRGRGGANNQINLIESHRFGMQVGPEEVRLPAVWLSQGYQAVISLVADIIGNVWLEAGAEVALDDMEGIVLVDELDFHLHPTWQTEIVAGLKRTFPRMQFIVTTHSPLVLAGCTADEVWMLKQDPDSGDVTAEQGEVSPMLLTAAELNREYFGIERSFASELGEALRRYVDFASNPYRSDVDDATMGDLRRHLLDNRVDVDYQPVPRKSAS